ELRALVDDEPVGEIPAALLTDECPRYEVDRLPAARRAASVDPVNHEPKAWIYEQYDRLVQSRTVRRPGLGAAMLRLRPSWRGLAIPPTPVVGCVGLVPDVRTVPRGWRLSNSLLLAESDGTLEGDVALIEFVWRAAPQLTLAHDVGDGGLELALAEASAFSGQ